MLCLTAVEQNTPRTPGTAVLEVSYETSPPVLGREGISPSPRGTRASVLQTRFRHHPIHHPMLEHGHTHDHGASPLRLGQDSPAGDHHRPPWSAKLLLQKSAWCANANLYRNGYGYGRLRGPLCRWAFLDILPVLRAAAFSAGCWLLLAGCWLLRLLAAAG
jgi:hypothetical protein